ncbi:hypothetical protein FE257_001984 [Aspergillus nanangensis]|uniref:Uncharacterized protein n=1 Tax=Aspergillus nanangensis TaxID=2582783 RepID=A0AAD4CEI5_ASPNN|nr:hypothetical protein FE257_001984 [Aspergillus nanangensis]
MPTLETLPAELRIQVLEEIPDIPSLHNLVQASFIYRDSYQRTRKTVLHQLATRVHGLVGVTEPLAAIGSEGLHAEVDAHRDDIIAVLDRRRCHSDDRVLLSEPQSVQLLQLYKKLEPVLQACCHRAARPAHVDAQTWQQDPTAAVSEAEKARILRALCRLQTYCNIFGAREWVEPEPNAQQRFLSPNLLKRRSTTWHRHFTIHEMWSLFFRTMPPWEVEEFGSVWTFMRETYVDLFADIAKDFPRDSAEWRALRPTTMPLDPRDLEENPEDEYSQYDYDDYCNHLVSLGPSFLAQVLQQPTEYARRRLLASNAVTGQSSFMDLVGVVTDPQPLLYPADRYEMPGITAILPTLPTLEQPARGWKHHWYGHDTIDRVMFPSRQEATNGLSDPVGQYTLGFYTGWTWGYALWDSVHAVDRSPPSLPLQ